MVAAWITISMYHTGPDNKRERMNRRVIGTEKHALNKKEPCQRAQSMQHCLLIENWMKRRLSLFHVPTRKLIKLNDCRYSHCLGIVLRAQFLNRGAWLFRLIGNEAPPNARYSREVALTLNHHCYHLMESAGSDGLWSVANPGHLDCASSTKPWILPGLRHRLLAAMQTLFTCFFNWE